MIASMLKVPEPAASPAAHWTLAGRLAAAATLVLGAGFGLAAKSIDPNTDSALEGLTWVADHPGLADLAGVFGLLYVTFLLGTTLVFVLLARRGSPRLAYAGGILLGCASIGLAAVIGRETLLATLAQDGRFDLAALADVVDGVPSAPTIVMLVIFIPFAFFGLLTVAAALWRSAAVPRAAVLMIPAFIITDFFLAEQGIIPLWAGHVPFFIFACWIASAVLLTKRV